MFVKGKNKRIFFDLLDAYVPWSILHSTVFCRLMKDYGYEIHVYLKQHDSRLTQYFDTIASKYFTLSRRSIKFFALRYMFRIIYINVANFASYFDVKRVNSLYIGGLYIGDLIHDTYTRRHMLPTADSLNFKYIAAINEAYVYYYYYMGLLDRESYEYVVVNHNCYIRSAMLARVASSRGVKVLHLLSTEYGFYIRKLYPDDHVYDLWSLANPVLYNASINNLDVVNKSLQYFEDTVVDGSGTFDKINKAIAVSGNDIVDYRQVHDLKINSPTKKIVVIASHVLIDNVTGADGRRQVYIDSYTWLKETLRLCESNSDMITFLKLHPREYAFNYAPKILDVYNEMRLQNVKIWPDNLDLKTNHRLIDVVITVRGSVSLEFPCFGIPVIVAGKNHAISSGFNTVVECCNASEYADAILSISKLGKMTEEEIVRAKVLYYLVYKSAFYTVRDGLLVTRHDVFKEECIGMDYKQLPDNYLIDSVDEYLLSKIDEFVDECGDEYMSDLVEFLYDDDYFMLGEIQYARENLLDQS